jgi:hypothetical protein
MAFMDHTARSRASVRKEPESHPTTTADVPLPRSADQERRRTDESRRAHTALAVAVMEGMLKSHQAFKKAHPKGKKRGLLPLNAVQIFGLEAAIDLLHQHVDPLNPEKSG